MTISEKFSTAVVDVDGGLVYERWLSRQSCSFHFPFLNTASSGKDSDQRKNFDCFFPGDTIAVTGGLGSGKATVLRFVCLISTLPKRFAFKLDESTSVAVALGGHEKPVHLFDFNYWFSAAALRLDIYSWLCRILEQHMDRSYSDLVRNQLDALVNDCLSRVHVYQIDSPYQVIAVLEKIKNSENAYNGSCILLGGLGPPLQHFMHKPAFDSTLPEWLRPSEGEKVDWRGTLEQWSRQRVQGDRSPLVSDASSPLNLTLSQANLYVFLKIVAAHPVTRKSVLFVSQLDWQGQLNSKFCIWQALGAHHFQLRVHHRSATGTVIKFNGRFLDICGTAKGAVYHTDLFAITRGGLALLS